MLSDIVEHEIQYPYVPVLEGLLFMGAGHSTAKKMNQLRSRLEDAFNVLSGKQQNGGMGHEFDGIAESADQLWLEAFAKDMAMAFVGKEIEFIGEMK